MAPSFRRYKEIISVLWKPPTCNCLKANTDGSLVGSSASYGDIFRDHLGTFFGGFAVNLGEVSIYEEEVMGLIVAMEFATSHGWVRIWLENDSTAAVHAFHKSYVIP